MKRGFFRVSKERVVSRATDIKVAHLDTTQTEKPTIPVDHPLDMFQQLVFGGGGSSKYDPQVPQAFETV